MMGGWGRPAFTLFAAGMPQFRCEQGHPVRWWTHYIHSICKQAASSQHPQERTRQQAGAGDVGAGVALQQRQRGIEVQYGIWEVFAVH